MLCLVCLLFLSFMPQLESLFVVFSVVIICVFVPVAYQVKCAVFSLFVVFVFHTLVRVSICNLFSRSQ